MEHLSPFCSKIGIVGSVRREQEYVKDIELCCTPNREIVPTLFDTTTQRCSRFVHEAKNLGEVLKGNPADGRYMQIMLPSGIKLDLFIPQAHDYYRQYAIRTGSATYSAQIIALGWRKLGWCGTEHGLRREEYCTHDGNGWKWNNRETGQELPPAWESEREFFDWLKVPFRHPKHREVYR